jgi:tetratricopeptide (TPR) repeat protein
MHWLKILFITALFLPCISAQNNSEQLKTKALENIDLGLFGEAIDLLNNYVSANPQDPSGYCYRGICYEKRSQFELAVYNFRSCLKLDPDNKEYQTNLARAIDSWNSLLYNKIVGYKREIDINPSNPVNYLEVGKCYKNLGEWVKAEDWYNEYLKKEEPSADEVLRYTEILSKTGHIEKGEKILKRFVEKYPEDHRLWSRYGYFTMWLGKKSTSIEAFKKALALRPFFMEALDGYDLVRGKGHIYTVNDTTTRYNYGMPVKKSYPVYLIDNLYKQLKKNPSNSEARFRLVDELVKHNRFEEATEELNILGKDFKGISEFEKLKESTAKKREDYYLSQVEKLKSDIEKNPDDAALVLKLAEYFSYLSENNDAIELLKKYLSQNLNNADVKFKLAKLLAWNGEYAEAKSILTELLNHNPSNVEFNLFFGQVCTWSGDYSTDAVNALEFVLSKDTNNYEALYTLANLQYQKNNLADARLYLNRAKIINPSNEDLTKLNYLIDQKSKQNVLDERYNQITKARELVTQKQCDEAIKIYKEIISESDDVQIQKELAEAYLCKSDFTDAIDIYNLLIFNDQNNYDLLEKRAKIYFWSGDYINTLQDINKLSPTGHLDSEMKLMLADTYFYLKDFSKSKQIYNELLSISPESYIINQRMSWFGPSAGNDFSFSNFPAYTMLNPEANYFADNFDFVYSTYGLKFEAGLNQFLSLGIGGYGGVIENDSLHNNISMFKGFLTGRLNKNISISSSAGVIRFASSINRFIGEIVFHANKNKAFDFSAGFYSMDAAQILYSPFLVEKRLIANMANINGNYYIKNNWKFSGDFSYFLISDKNKGNRLRLRLGKFISNSLIAGYEYYLYDFKDLQSYYWSPENFESHSIWSEWNISETDNLTAALNFKIGYLPAEKFILREFAGTAIYKFTTGFALQGTATFSTTIQSGKGYSSTSFGLFVYWYL